MSTPKKFSPEYKAAAVARINAGESIRDLAKKLDVSATALWRWKQDGVHSDPDRGRTFVAPAPTVDDIVIHEMEPPATEFDNALLAEDNARLSRKCAALTQLVQVLLAERAG